MKLTASFYRGDKMSTISDNMKMKLLDFKNEKRRQWEKERKLYAVHFEITPRCNFSCVHCYLRDHHNEEQLSYDRIIEILDILYSKSILFITFTGGEIFSRQDFLEIYMYAKRKGFIIELFTNAYLITPQIIDTLAKYPPLLVDVSLYGSNDETYQRVTGIKGAFSRVVNNCRMLVEAGVRVALKSPVLTLTYNELSEMKQIGKQLGIPFRASFELIPTIDNDSSTKQYQVSSYQMLAYEFDDIISQKNTDIEREDRLDIKPVNRQLVKPLFRCKVGLTSCIIDYNGFLCPCMKFKHRGAKLSADTFDNIWKEFGELASMHASSSYKCLTCDAYNYCDICPAEMESIFGDLEYIEKSFCRIAFARKCFYENNHDMDNALSSL